VTKKKRTKKKLIIFCKTCALNLTFLPSSQLIKKHILKGSVLLQKAEGNFIKEFQSLIRACRQIISSLKSKSIQKLIKTHIINYFKLNTIFEEQVKKCPF